MMAFAHLSDLDLVGQLRQGHGGAWGELFERHRPMARRVAKTFRCGREPDDLVSEAFEKVFAAIRRGHGPNEGFRAYLLVTMRRLAAGYAERPHEHRIEEIAEPAAPLPLAAEDRDLITEAFRSLPDRCQAVLWYTAVEGRSPSDLAGLLGISANAAAAAAYRGRQQLRQAYLNLNGGSIG